MARKTRKVNRDKEKARLEKKIAFREEQEKQIVDYIAYCESHKEELKLEITEKHTGKMQGFSSLSTSPLYNPLCRKRSLNPDLICFYCFSDAMNMTYKDLRLKLIRNSVLLASDILRDEQFPHINSETRIYKYFRLESFGDLNNEIQAINYFRFCELNPETRFTLWTKNPVFIHKAILKGYSKPANLTIIYSSPYLNKPAKQVIFDMFPFIDKIFTVYSKEQAERENIAINCGARDCKTCLKCYKANDIKEINELLK